MLSTAKKLAFVAIKCREQSKKSNSSWTNLEQLHGEIDATGCTTVICRECKQVFKHPSMASTLSYHWSKRHPNREQPAAKLRRLTSPRRR
uniref:BED-type domain-containing protein n=1 Tax=Ditylenchus dipsaci TaxID=166011 RepID=A0A915EK47_9BILA